MKSTSYTKAIPLGVFSALLTVCTLSKAHAQLTYTFYPNDTTINSVVNTDLAIVGFAGGSYDASFNPHFTSPSSPTVNVVTGADVSEIDSFNHSIVNASGGHIGAIFPQNSSTLNLNGSAVDFALNFEQGVINMNAGNVADLEGQGKQINVSGGTVGTLVANTNTDLFGMTLGSSIVNVTGGNITSEVDAYNDGILNVHGGQFGGDLYARFGGTINIFGSGLQATLLDSNFNRTYSLYSLSGLLDNGTVLNDQNLFIENDGVTYGHSSFTLVNATPEPGNLALLSGIGVSGAGMFIRRRKRHARR